MSEAPGTVRWVTGSGEAPVDVLLAEPSARPTVAVILYPDGFGIHDHIEHAARRLADAGALVAVPDVFHRLGRRVRFTLDTLDDAMVAIAGVSEADVERATSVAVGVLTAAAGGVPAMIGIGFCFGGRIALVARGVRPSALRGCIALYPNGMLQKPAAWTRPPIGWATQGSSPVLLLFGGADRLIPNDEAEAVVAALEASGAQVDSAIYADVGHAFLWEEHPNHDPRAADDAWERITRFLRDLSEPAGHGA
jgi:carboxymethylenebutenolidase